MASLKLSGYPLSQTLPTHTPGACHPPAPEPSTCSINRLVIRVLSYRQQFPGQRFCQLAFSHHHLSGRPARIPESCRAALHLSGSSCWHLSRSGVSVRDSGTRHILGSSTLSSLTPGDKLVLCVCVRHAASSSLTRDRAQAPCIGSVES